VERDTKFISLFAHYLRRVCPDIIVIVQKAETAFLVPALSEESKFPQFKLEHAPFLRDTNLTNLLDEQFPNPLRISAGN